MKMFKSKKGVAPLVIPITVWVVGGLITLATIGGNAMKAATMPSSAGGAFGSVPPVAIIAIVVFAFLILMRR